MKSNIVGKLIAAASALLLWSAWADNLPADYAATSNFKMGALYGGAKYDGSTWADREMWQGDDVEIDLQLEGESGNTFAFIPVTGTGVLEPVVIGDLPKKHIASVKVWTDQEMFDTFTPKGVSSSKWEDDDEGWEYESGKNWYWWPKSAWPANKVVADRRWIVVMFNRNVDYWAGAKTLRVGIAGTSVVSDSYTVLPEELVLNPDISGFTHGMTVSGVEYFAPMEDVKEITWWPYGYDYTNAVQQYEFNNHVQCVRGKPMSFTVDVPSAGTLVVAGEDDDEDSLAMKSAFTVSGKNIKEDNAVWMSDDEDDPNYLWTLDNYFKNTFSRWVRRISVSGATTLTFTRKDRDDSDAEFNRIYFFPANKKSVAIEAGFVSPDANWGRRMTMHGYVTGSGVYTVGETATLTAIPGDGEAFDHWEEVWGGKSGLTEEDMHSPTLSFKVTEDMCGEEWEESQIVVFAVWKPKYVVEALPSIVGAGTTTGTGRYFEGESATLSATPAHGYDFVKWSDGVTSAKRTLKVSAADRAVYACFKRNGDPIDEGNTFGPFIAGDKVDVDVGLVGYAAKGLPSGLKYDAKTGTVTGSAKTPGTYEVTFTKKGEADETAVFEIRAEEVSVECAGLSQGSFVAGVAGNAGGIPFEIKTETGIKSVAVSKLPAGMKYDAKTGLVTGGPAKAGDYEVAVTVTTMGGAKQVVTIHVAVAPLPKGAVGTFNGFVKTLDGEENLGAFQLTATDAGKLTAKLTTAAGAYSFSGAYWDSVEDGVYSVALATKKGETLTLSLDSAAGWDANQLTGEFSVGGVSRAVVAHKNAFGKAWYFNAVGNEAAGWVLSYAENAKAAALAVTLNADGSTKIAGKLGTLSVNASGYADVTSLSEGVIIADFAPVVSVKEGGSTVKRVLSIGTNLWFDRSGEHGEGVGFAKIVE